MQTDITTQPIVDRLRIRASIRRNAIDRKSVQEGKSDRLADLLEEAADVIEYLVCNTRIKNEQTTRLYY